MSAAANNRPLGVSLAALGRIATLLLALAMSGLILANPRMFAHAGHGLLTLVMLGVCAGFVHGVGFVPRAMIWRIVFSPWLAWALMGLGLWQILAA